MSPQELDRIRRHARKGDVSAKRLLDLLAAMADAHAELDGIAMVRGMVGEHNDIYDQAIDGTMTILIPAIMTAMDAKTLDEFVEHLRWYVPQSKGGEG